MGVLDRLQSWLGIGSEAEETNEADKDDESESSDPTGLDPDNVTEVRTESSDDAAEKLQNMTADDDREEP
ncbi:hypothetical protein [Natranaeroarchaeum aerophilus]|uniref:Uncharacterized protein n=1 Tax=Natranaeroarchaeum aerophilus TaxID=2917711 RepID=A0AAE3FRH2_9EURY|nr:hypothetical protein [Natranaeroarchaeum aerophilus]MCL9814297.1 hypothetical protein [Natranaeroarchaeum aerophilus]